jgi:hypothetical protein
VSLVELPQLLEPLLADLAINDDDSLDKLLLLLLLNGRLRRWRKNEFM